MSQKHHRTGFFSSPGLAIVQRQSKMGKFFNNINNSTSKIKQAMASQFPELVSRTGISKRHIVKLKVLSEIYSKAPKRFSHSDFFLTYNLEVLMDLTDCKKRTISRNFQVALKKISFSLL